MRGYPRRLFSVVSSFLFLLFTFVSVLSGPDAGGVSAAELDDTVLVYDASRSMWGQVGGQSKIVIARRAFGELIHELEGSTNLGVVAYGNRSTSCRDIRTVIPVGPINKKRYQRVINRIQPRGRTPMTSAIEKAADELDYRNKKATIILISDGLESCRRNPCKVTARLEKQAKDLTIHVIGLDVRGKKVETLSCVATNTGGKFIPANDSQELQTAVDSVILAMLSRREKAKPTMAQRIKSIFKRKPAKEKNTAMAALPGRVTITTVKSDGKSALSWVKIFNEADYNKGGKPKHVARGLVGKTGTSFRLPAGNYLAAARSWGWKGSERFSVKSGATTSRMVRLYDTKKKAAPAKPKTIARKTVIRKPAETMVSDGTVKVYILNARGRPVGSWLKIFSAKEFGKEGAKIVSRGRAGAGGRSFQLPPGSYVATARSYANKGRQRFTVRAGKPTDTVVKLAARKMTAAPAKPKTRARKSVIRKRAMKRTRAAMMTPDGSARIRALNSKGRYVDSWVKIYKADKFGKDGVSTVARGGAIDRGRKFNLQPGSYVATARSFGEKGQQRFWVRSGRSTDTVVRLAARKMAAMPAKPKMAARKTVVKKRLATLTTDGRARVRALNPGGRYVGSWIKVFKADEFGKDGVLAVARGRTGAKGRSFNLPPGRYVATARAFGKKGHQNFYVRSGRATDTVVRLSRGKMAAMAPTRKKPRKSVIRRAPKKAKTVAVMPAAGMSSMKKAVNGVLKMSSVGANGKAAGRTFYKIYDGNAYLDQNKLHLITGGSGSSARSFNLPDGIYFVKASSWGKVASRVVRVRSGKATNTRLTLSN